MIKINPPQFQSPLPYLQPIGLTIRINNGVEITETIPGASINIANETFLALSPAEWFSTGSTIYLVATDPLNPSVDIILHPNPALAEGFAYETTPLATPSELFWIQYPPNKSQADGIVIHSNLSVIFTRVDELAKHFSEYQKDYFSKNEIEILSKADRNRMFENFIRDRNLQFRLRIDGLSKLRQTSYDHVKELIDSKVVQFRH